MGWFRRERSQDREWGATDAFLVGYAAQVEVPADLMGVGAVGLRFVRRQFGPMRGIWGRTEPT